jgi:hypothetical protein
MPCYVSIAIQFRRQKWNIQELRLNQSKEGAMITKNDIFIKARILSEGVRFETKEPLSQSHAFDTIVLDKTVLAPEDGVRGRPGIGL